MMLRVSAKHNLAMIFYSPEVERLIPHSKVFENDGRKFLLVPAKKEELQLLRNLGYETPSPLNINYDWCGIVPFKAQVATADMLVHNPRAFVLNEMGTGKSLSALFAFDYLRKQKLVRSMLVVAPMSTLTTVWEREVFTRMPHLSTRVLWHPQANKRRDLLRDKADIYIINHDGIKTIHRELMAKQDIDVVLIDELAVYRNKRTDRWKMAHAVSQNRKFVWGMTGSPTPKQPCDAWAQIRLINPGMTTPYYKAFQEKTMVQVSQFRWIPKHEANNVVYEHMQPAVRFTRDDCVDLPPTTYSTRTVNMTSEQSKVYKELLDNSYAMYGEGTINAANAAVAIGKLLQVGCGFAYDVKGKVITLEAKHRLALLDSIIDECSNKLIVFAPFIYAVDKLYEDMESRGHDVVRVYGDTSKGERDRIFAEFQNSSSIKAIIAHPQTMAHGLTLTAADTVVWYSPTHSAEIYEQANARITRPGQKNHTHIIHIEASPLEAKIYGKIRSRLDTQAALLELFGEMNARTNH
jgi:SNF2 family DNA or RNA helicase